VTDVEILINEARIDALDEAIEACQNRAAILDEFDDECRCCKGTANNCAADIKALKPEERE